MHCYCHDNSLHTVDNSKSIVIISITKKFTGPWNGVCVHDTYPIRLLPTLLNVPSLTPSKCIEACKEKGLYVAGVQNAKECWCGTAAPSEERIVKKEECNHNCVGDSSIKCGGSMRMNVFKSKGITYNINWFCSF